MQQSTRQQLRHATHTPVPVTVETHRLIAGDSVLECWEFESSKVIDHANSSDRKWLGAHCFWAARNGRRVTTYPESN